jgi:hypothetical protein
VTCRAASALLISCRQRRGRGNDLSTTIKYLLKTTSGAAGNDLGTTAKYPQPTIGTAAGSALGTKVNYLRRGAGKGRAKRPNFFGAQRVPTRARAWAP